MAMAKWRNKCINITTRLSLNWWPRQACKHDGTTDPCGTWAVSMLTYIHFTDFCFFLKRSTGSDPRLSAYVFRESHHCAPLGQPCAWYMERWKISSFVGGLGAVCGVRCALPSFTPYVLQPSPLRLLFHAAPMAPDAHRSFNFNKLRSFLISRVRAPSDEYDIDVDIDIDIRCAFFPPDFTWIQQFFQSGWGSGWCWVGLRPICWTWSGLYATWAASVSFTAFRSGWWWPQIEAKLPPVQVRDDEKGEDEKSFFRFLLLFFAASICGKWPWIIDHGWLHLLCLDVWD